MILPNRKLLLSMTVAEAANIVNFIMKAELKDKIAGNKDCSYYDMLTPLLGLITDEEFEVIRATSKEEMKKIAKEKNISIEN